MISRIDASAILTLNTAPYALVFIASALCTWMNASSPPDSASNANAANIITAYRLASDSMASFFSSISMRADHGSSRCSRLPPQATAASQCSALLVIARLPDSSAACDEMACIPIRTSPAARATTCRPRVFMRTLRQKAAKKSPASSSWAASNTGSCDAAMRVLGFKIDRVAECDYAVIDRSCLPVFDSTETVIRSFQNALPPEAVDAFARVRRDCYSQKSYAKIAFRRKL